MIVLRGVCAIASSIHGAIHTFPVLSNALQKEIAKNLPKALAGRTGEALSSTALSSLHTRLIPRACDRNPRVLHETSTEIWGHGTYRF
jgi:hypothetical protein